MNVPRSLGDLSMLGRMARDVPAFIRTPITVEHTAELVKARLATRDERFLAMAERTIYANPRSPYLALLRMAGCEPGDLRSLVRREGVEGALRELAGRGVYVTFDELKGRAEMVRGSRRFRFADVDFDNRQVSPHVALGTGGTRGTPTRVKWSLRDGELQVGDTALWLEAGGVRAPWIALWTTTGIPQLLLHAPLGHPLRAWFYPLRQVPRRTRVAATAAHLLGRLCGRRFPFPRAVPLQEGGS